MFNNEEVMHALEAGHIDIKQAMAVLTGGRATDGDRLAIGTVIARIDKNSQVEVSAWGYRDWDNREAVEASDVFRIFSVTKTCVADVIHQLCDEGALKLEDKLWGKGGWIERMQQKKPELATAFAALHVNAEATVEDLLKHTSGVGNYSQGEFADHANRNPDKAWTLVSLLEHNQVVKDGKGRNNEYGKFNYSDSGYNLLGLIIEHIENRSYELSLQERVIDPYALQNTYFRDKVEIRKDHIAQGYIENPATKKPTSGLCYETGKAAGGLLSTVTDMITYGRALYKKAKGSLGALVDIPKDSAYCPGTQYSRIGVTVQKDRAGKPVLVMSGNARGGKAKVCCYESGACIATLESWENLTIKAAKELTRTHPATFKDLKVTILAIRKAFSDDSIVPPQYDRTAMLECFEQEKSTFSKKVQGKYAAAIQEVKDSQGIMAGALPLRQIRSRL